MKAVTDLLERPVYGIAQVDRLLALSSGTSRRWIDGYQRGAKAYPPLVRIEPTGEEIVTWGEFVEARLLSEYRDAGVSIIRMRPAIEKLREAFNTKYPLAHAKPFLEDNGKDLVLRVQNEVHLDKPYQLVVVKNNQLILAPHAEQFVQSVEYGKTSDIAERVHPSPELMDVVMDPLRQFGEPVVRSVQTAVIAEQMRAGDSIEMISDLYELTTSQVESAIRFELKRGTYPVADTAA